MQRPTRSRVPPLPGSVREDQGTQPYLPFFGLPNPPAPCPCPCRWSCFAFCICFFVL
ncbi:hypothetical protein AHAS_Ahas15G0265800 [Arachis hypogaea]